MGKVMKFATKEEEDEAFLASIRLDPEAHAQALAQKDATADPLAKDGEGYEAAATAGG